MHCAVVCKLLQGVLWIFVDIFSIMMLYYESYQDFRRRNDILRRKKGEKKFKLEVSVLIQKSSLRAY